MQCCRAEDNPSSQVWRHSRLRGWTDPLWPSFGQKRRLWQGNFSSWDTWHSIIIFCAEYDFKKTLEIGIGMKVSLHDWFLTILCMYNVCIYYFVLDCKRNWQNNHSPLWQFWCHCWPRWITFSLTDFPIIRITILTSFWDESYFTFLQYL